MGHHAGEQCELSRRKWDFTGITEAQQLGSAVHPLAPREDPQTPSYVHITDRLAARYVCEGGAYRHPVCVWGASKEKNWILRSLGPVNSSTAPRQQTTREGGQTRGWTAERSGAARDYCRSAINHPTAENGVIAPDSKWHTSVSSVLSWCLPLCPTLSIIVNITQCQRQHPCLVCTTRWSYTHHDRGISVSSVGYVQPCPSYEITGLCLLRLSNNWKLRGVCQTAEEVLAQDLLQAECKADWANIAVT